MIGTLKIRSVTKSSKVISLPSNLVRDLNIENGHYKYSIFKENEKLKIELELLFREENNV